LDILRPLALALFAATLLGAAPARADLAADAARLVEAWSKRGADAKRLDPVFLEHGRVLVQPVVPADETFKKPGCLMVVVLGAPTVDFSVAPDPLTPPQNIPGAMLPPMHPPVDGDADTGVESTMGMAWLSRCGSARRELARVGLSMRSQRGSLEIVVARADDVLGDLEDVLPERALGPVAPHGSPGRPLSPGPVVERLARAEQRARSEGATKIERLPAHAAMNGTGELTMRLGEGCHRLELMAEVPGTLPRRVTDVDLDVRDTETGQLLARDRSDAADGRAEFCLGATTRVTLQFVGAAGPVPLTVQDAVWPIARTVPVHWGARPRAGFAQALRRRHAPDPPAEVVAEALGVQGHTDVPVALVPGRCYLAAVAAVRGEVRRMRLVASVGDRFARDEVGERGEGAAVAFCAESEDAARFEVEVSGNSVWWALSIWPMGAGP
jgi:hypothetical protein